MSLPREIGNFYKVELDRPIRYKREVYRVSSVEPLRWKPGYAYVRFDSFGFIDTAGPIKIYHRKNGTAYVNFCGRRFDVDENLYKMQFIAYDRGLIEKRND